MVKKNVPSMAKTLELFHHGENYHAYRFFGSHKTKKGRKEGVVFRVWAPNATHVSVVGDFNDWNGYENIMSLVADGIWEAFIPNIPEFSPYKYAITFQDGSTHLKADPYAVHSETNGNTASKVFFMEDCFEWTDDAWFKKRDKEPSVTEKPMNIYEVHLGSWKRYPDGEHFDYHKLADELIPYVKDMGYTHVELMPITEYPLEASWGYQVTGYFSVTSRYGTPADFMYFVNKAHKAGIGVIVDWVPAHFPRDDWALARFDGTPLYEDGNPLRGEHKSWGTLIFDYGKPEIQSFLISSAMMLIKEYHIDGLRVDAVAAMLYLDYDRNEWCPNYYGGKENLEAIAFLQKLNHAIGVADPHAMMIAEESTAWPMVTRPPEDGGLGFHYKWNMGWMNDSLSYIEKDPIYRQYEHGKLTFPLMYAFSENFILPISHDEVVYGKRSFIDKMPGIYEQKFAGLRSYLVYMLSQPGKKLTFMGTEIGQFNEWQFAKELDWMVLAFEAHAKLKDFVKEINHFYIKNKCMWELDDSWEGFKWINADDSSHNILSYTRIGKNGRSLTFVINFSPVLRENYRIGVPKKKTYKEILNTDDVKFGGNGILNAGDLKAVLGEENGMKYHLELTLPPLGAIILK